MIACEHAQKKKVLSFTLLMYVCDRAVYSDTASVILNAYEAKESPYI